MSAECWVIIVLILAMAVIIMRRSTPRQGIAILPLALSLIHIFLSAGIRHPGALLFSPLFLLSGWLAVSGPPFGASIKGKNMAR